MISRNKLRVYAEQHFENGSLPQDKIEAVKVLVLLDIADALDRGNEANGDDLLTSPEEIRERMEADPNYIPMEPVTKKKRTTKAKAPATHKEDTTPNYTGTKQAKAG